MTAMVPGTRRWFRRPVVVAAAVVLAVRLVLAGAMATPIVQPDEGGYLGIAHYLAFGTGLAPAGSAYSPGWGILLAPFSRVLHDPLETYRAALVVNALLGVASFGCLVALARRLAPSRPEPQLIAAALVVAMTPALVLSSGLANATTLFAASALVIAVLAARAWEVDRPRRWMMLGLAAGALVSVHPTVLAVVVGVVAAAVFGLRPPTVRSAAVRFASLAVGALPAAAGAIVLARRVSDATPAGNGARADTRLAHTADLVGHAVGARNVVGVLAELSGQLLYLSASTACLFLIGLVAGLRSIFPAIRSPHAPTKVRLQAYAAVVSITALAASVLVINPPDNSPLERLLYGRYNEHVVAIVLLIGVLGLLDRSGAPHRWRLIAMSGAVVSLLAIVFVGVRSGRPGNVLVERQDVLGLNAPLYLLQRVVHPTLWPTVILLVIAAVGGGAAIGLLPTRSGALATMAAIGASSIALIVAGAVLLVRGSNTRAEEHQLVASIADHVRQTSDGCVGYDPTLDADWHLATYEFMLPTVRFAPFAIDGSGAVPVGQLCTEAVLAPPGDLALGALGLVPVAYEHTPQQPVIVLYVRRIKGA